MKKLAALAVTNITALLLIAGYVSETATPEDIASEGAALCENRDGVNSVMTALAVAAATEMRRVLPQRDFAWNSTTGRLETTNYGRARCPNGACPNVEAVLTLQNAPSN